MKGLLYVEVSDSNTVEDCSIEEGMNILGKNRQDIEAHKLDNKGNTPQCTLERTGGRTVLGVIGLISLYFYPFGEEPNHFWSSSSIAISFAIAVGTSQVVAILVQETATAEPTMDIWLG